MLSTLKLVKLLFEQSKVVKDELLVKPKLEIELPEQFKAVKAVLALTSRVDKLLLDTLS